jgi:hypothetical protein
MPSFAGISEKFASAAMIQVGGSQKELGNMQKVEVQRPGRYSYGKEAIGLPSTANSS